MLIRGADWIRDAALLEDYIYILEDVGGRDIIMDLGCISIHGRAIVT